MEFQFHLHPVVSSNETDKADRSAPAKRIDPACVWVVVCPRFRISHALLETRVDLLWRAGKRVGTFQFAVEMLVKSFVDVEDGDRMLIFGLNQDAQIQRPRHEIEEWDGGSCGGLH